MSERYMDCSIIKRAAEQLSCDMAGEAVVLNMKSGEYFGMQNVAALIWNLLEKPCTFAEVREAIMREYDIGAEACERDLESFIEEMRRAALIQIENGSHP